MAVPGFVSNSFVAGEVPTTSKWNELWGNDNAFNTFLSGSGTASATILTNPYKFSAYQSVAQTSIVSATPTKVTFDTENFDTGNNFSTSTYLFTAPIAGFYHFNARIKFASMTSSSHIYIYKNGSAVAAVGNVSESGGFPQPTISTLLQLAANDTVGVYGQQDSGSNKNMQVDDASTIGFAGFFVSTT